jgi:hypothetical protein
MASSASSVRISLDEAETRIRVLLGASHSVPLSVNKGSVGLWLERAVGIPASGACLDCVDGELKVFPLMTNRAGALVSKETVAVTMVDASLLCSQAFEDSRVYKKLENTLFVPYLRTGNDVVFYTPVRFTKEHALMEKLKEDYGVLQTNARAGVFTGTLGEYLQTRTKGAGHGSTSRAFYLRRKFVEKAVLPASFSSTPAPHSSAPTAPSSELPVGS